MSIKAAGLDLSMTATGVAHTVGAGAACTHVIKTKGTKDDRLVVIRGQVRELTRGAGLVLIEGFLQKSFSAGTTGMVHGAVRTMLIEDKIKYGVLPPSSLKKFATGRGNATKTDMAVAAYKRGDGAEFHDDNQVDAWWLWVAAMTYTGQAPFTLPMAQVDQLDNIEMRS